jgi:hypothetical protein
MTHKESMREGETQAYWARRLGVSQASLSQRVKKYGPNDDRTYLPRRGVVNTNPQQKQPPIKYVFTDVGGLYYEARDPLTMRVVTRDIVQLMDGRWGWNCYHGFEAETRNEVVQKLLAKTSVNVATEDYQ